MRAKEVRELLRQGHEVGDIIRALETIGCGDEWGQVTVSTLDAARPGLDAREEERAALRLDFGHGLIVGHRRAVRVAATTNDDGEAVAAVIAKADFLMGATEHFDLHVGQLNVSHLVHGGVDDEQLRGHGALVLGTGKEHAIAGNAEFCRELVAKPVGLPVGQRDFRHGESAAVVEVNGGGNLFHTEVGHPGFDDATDAFVRCSVPLQANGLCDGVGHGNDLCFKAMRCRIRRPCR